jgi:hypothetical protein
MSTTALMKCQRIVFTNDTISQIILFRFFSNTAAYTCGKRKQWRFHSKLFFSSHASEHLYVKEQHRPPFLFFFSTVHICLIIQSNIIFHIYFTLSTSHVLNNQYTLYQQYEIKVKVVLFLIILKLNKLTPPSHHSWTKQILLYRFLLTLNIAIKPRMSNKKKTRVPIIQSISLHQTHIMLDAPCHMSLITVKKLTKRK